MFRVNMYQMGSLGEDPVEQESERVVVTNVLEAGEDLVEPYVCVIIQHTNPR